MSRRLCAASVTGYAAGKISVCCLVRSFRHSTAAEVEDAGNVSASDLVYNAFTVIRHCRLAALSDVPILPNFCAVLLDISIAVVRTKAASQVVLALTLCYRYFIFVYPRLMMIALELGLS